MKNLLIISNNVLCETDNNGKTLLNIIKDIPKNKVSQLYFYGNMPKIDGYRYFQLSNMNILKGRISSKHRGREISPTTEIESSPNNNVLFILKNKILKRTGFTLCLREGLWKNSWYSPQLENWLNEIQPEIVLFMAGDAVFAYDICDWIIQKYRCELFTYVTDDYIVERTTENYFEKQHRIAVYGKMIIASQSSKMFFTICERMRREYRDKLEVDSKILVNRCERMYDSKLSREYKNEQNAVFMYAGSLYYGRDTILIELAKALKLINEDETLDLRKAILIIYSCEKTNKFFLNELNKVGTAQYRGSLKPHELKRELNHSDFPVFVESFDLNQIEKVRLSFSTKVPEYLSLKKPILAIGPPNIGSMDCFENTAICANSIKEIYNATLSLLSNSPDQHDTYVKNALKMYDELMDYPKLSEYLEDEC